MLTLWTWKVTNLGGSEHWSTFWSTVSILGLHNDFNRKHRSLVVRSRRVCRKIILFSFTFLADTWFWSIHSSHDPEGSINNLPNGSMDQLLSEWTVRIHETFPPHQMAGKLYLTSCTSSSYQSLHNLLCEVEWSTGGHTFFTPAA